MSVFQHRLEENLRKAIELYSPRSWSPELAKIWSEVLRGWKPDQLDAAFQDYYANGSHMPKPADIRKILLKLFPPKSKEDIERERTSKEPESYTKPREEVNLAWKIYQTHFICLMDWSVERGAIPDDEVLRIVNESAARTMQFGSVWPEFKLDRFWPGELGEKFYKFWKDSNISRSTSHTGVFKSVSDILARDNFGDRYEKAKQKRWQQATQG